jgi:TM2 domain-containing membrane protein YozV
MCSRCGAGLYGDAARAGANGAVESKRIIAALCAFFLGAFGVHKFVLNRTGQGLLRLGITIIGGIVTLGLAAAAMSVIGMIEGVIYFTKTDADFIRIYQVGDKAWF